MTRDDDFDAGSLSGAYALGALSDEDKRAFEEEMVASEELRTEVAGFLDTTSVLAMAVEPIDPPAALKANIMAMLDSTPQLAPAIPHEAESVAASAQTQEPQLANVSNLSEHVATGRSARTSRRRIRPLTALVAAAAAVAIFAGGAAAGGLLGSVGDERQSDQFAALNSASDVTREVTPLAAGGTAALISSDELDMAAVVLTDAPALTEDEVYQLWYMHDQTVTSAGIVDPDAHQTYAMLPSAIDPEYAVAMTIEPAGGSDHPTGIPTLLTGA